MNTYYDILEVGPRASAHEIKAAHRRLVKKFHPDRTLSANTAVRRSLEDRFRDIQEAYDTLRDKAKRAEYDDMLAMLNLGEYYEPPPPPPPPLPNVTFLAGPSTVEKGQLVMIRWASKNATDLRLELGTGVSTVGPRGWKFVRLQDSTTFALTATGPGGTQRATASVTVIIPDHVESCAEGLSDAQREALLDYYHVSTTQPFRNELELRGLIDKWDKAGGGWMLQRDGAGRVVSFWDDVHPPESITQGFDGLYIKNGRFLLD
jgi:DnaJ-domain-containing protein 1